MIRQLAHAEGSLPADQRRAVPGMAQVVTPHLYAIRPRTSRDERFLSALHELADSFDVLSRRIESLEARTPGAPEVMSAADVVLIYKGRLSRTKLYQLSNPSRPGGAVLTRVQRRGGGTGFLRSEIERWLRGLPTQKGSRVNG